MEAVLGGTRHLKLSLKSKAERITFLPAFFSGSCPSYKLTSRWTGMDTSQPSKKWSLTSPRCFWLQCFNHSHRKTPLSFTRSVSTVFYSSWNAQRICGMRIYHEILTSGKRGLALFRACEHAFTAWASSCSRRQWIVAASQILKGRIRQNKHFGVSPNTSLLKSVPWPGESSAGKRERLQTVELPRPLLGFPVILAVEPRTWTYKAAVLSAVLQKLIFHSLKFQMQHARAQLTYSTPTC